jgi:ElaB/YqjD/DUF883 family membrane-anchored ribosome-binding protein
MSRKNSHSIDITELTEEARELLAATAHVAGDKVSEARERLTAALEQIKKGAQAADKAIHENPYKALGIAAGIGVLVGYFLIGRNSKSEE